MKARSGATQRVKTVRVAVAAAFTGAMLLGLTTASPAAADLDESSAAAPADLELRITPLDVNAEEAIGDPDVVSLTCDPSGGTHPTPGAACQSLDAVDGVFEELPSRNTACPLIWAPVLAQATGEWDGGPADYSEVFSNACVAAASTDDVFNFSDLP